MIAAFLILSAAPAEFPLPYRGRWGETSAGCSSGAVHGGLTIERTAVVDGEFSGRVRSVRRESDGSLLVAERWDVPEEGPQDLRVNYRLSRDGKSLTLVTNGEAADAQRLIRCKVAR